MRRMINVWTETEFTSFSVAIVAGRVVGSVTVCTPEKPMSYVVFSFIYAQGWERRVVSWVVDMLCCAVGQVAPVGVNCKLMPGLENVLASSTGQGTVTVVPLRLVKINKTLVDVSVRVMGGIDVHTMLNHLQTRLKVKEFMDDPIILACPKLLQVILVLNSRLFGFYVHVFSWYVVYWQFLYIFHVLISVCARR